MWTALLSVCFLIWATANRNPYVNKREKIQITVSSAHPHLRGRPLKTSRPLLIHHTDNTMSTASDSCAAVVADESLSLWVPERMECDVGCANGNQHAACVSACEELLSVDCYLSLT